MLLELELPRLLAPDLPSSRFLLFSLSLAHSNCTTCGCALLRFVAASPCGIGQFSRLLPSVDVLAISQANSPESNPNSPLQIVGLLGH
jgi:hypothetical protein